MVAIDDIQTAPTKRFSLLRRLAPFLLLGPISGLLLAGVVFNFRARKPVVASLYAVALVVFVVLLPYVTAMVGLKDMTMILGRKGL